MSRWNGTYEPPQPSLAMLTHGGYDAWPFYKWMMEQTMFWKAFNALFGLIAKLVRKRERE